MSVEVSFGAWLRTRRKMLDLTQEALSERIGCSVAMIRKIEGEERRPSRQMAELLADVLEIAADERGTFLRVARGEQRVERLATAARATGGQSTGRPAGYLPTPPTPLVGRETERGEIARLLHHPDCRLLTLVGPGGIGKTRLVLDAAVQQREAFADGVYFVSLGPVSSAEFIVPAMADALGYTFHGTGDPQTQVLNYLREKNLLLVLDNLEHLLDGAGLISTLLRNAPDVKLLVTSRERLNLQGEWVLDVAGLPFPNEAYHGAIETFSAVELFLQSARRAHVGFSPHPEDAPAIVRICRLVEGMPLGIELAAAWVRTLSCREIAQEIERNVDFLAVSARGVPERHRSMRAVFDHSWNLLSETERRALRYLSVFRGGFRREAGERVAGTSLPVLWALISKSFLRQDHSGRYELHELLGQYAEEKLREVSVETDEAHERHGAYYAEFLNRREEHLKGAKQREASQEVGDEIENVRAAWHWAIEGGKVGVIEQSLAGLVLFYEMRGRFQEGVAAFRRAVDGLRSTGAAAEPGAPANVLLGKALASQGWFAYRLGSHAAAEDLFREGLALIDQADAARAMMLPTLAFGPGNLAKARGEYAEARQLYQASVTTYQAAGEIWGVAGACYYLGDIAQLLGESAEAKRLFQESLALRQTLDDRRGIAYSLKNLGNAAFDLAEYAEAKQLYQDSLAIFNEIDDWRGIAWALIDLGHVYQTLGEYLEARRLAQESLAILKEIGDRRGRERAFNLLGVAASALDDNPAAWKDFQNALADALAIQSTPDVLEILVGMATLLKRRGDDVRAAELVSIVQQHPAGRKRTRAGAQGLLAELAHAASSGAKVKTLDVVVAEMLRMGLE